MMCILFLTGPTNDELKSKQEAPTFLAVVRNFTLKAQYTAKEDIDRFLQITTNLDNRDVTDPLANQKNAIRKSMIQSFRSLECVRLPPPAYNLEMLQDLDNVKFVDLPSEFKSSFNEMCKFMRSLIRPKAINGEKFNGYKMAEYMKSCADLINKEKSVLLFDAFKKI